MRLNELPTKDFQMIYEIEMYTHPDELVRAALKGLDCETLNHAAAALLYVKMSKACKVLDRDVAIQIILSLENIIRLHAMRNE